MAEAAPTILLVDDEVSLLESLGFLLEQQGYRVCSAQTGSQCLEAVAQHCPDLVVLDVMLPEMDGFEVCRRLRAQGFEAPVLLLTARGEEIDQVVGLELGADDYITKPFRHRELLARIRAHLRRCRREPPADPGHKAGDLCILPDRREATLRGVRLELSPKEYQLLAFLVENRRKVQTRERILNAVWGYDFDGETRVVNVTIQRLRDKIEVDPGQPAYIVTVRGAGYMLDV